MKTERMFRCILLMLGGKKLTSAELSRELEVSRRSVQRYIESLEDAGFPVIRTMGVNGGYSLPSDFSVKGSFFTEEEYGIIKESLLSGGSPEADKKRILRKVEKISDGAEEEGIFFPEEEDDGIRLIIEKAAAEKRCLEIEYTGRDGRSSTRVTEPLRLFYRDGARYLYAFCRERGDFRTFKLGRIKEAALLDERFAAREFFLGTDLSLFPENDGRITEITFFAEESVYDDVASWLGEDKITPCGRKYLVHASELSDKTLIRKLLYLGTDVKLLSPEGLKRDLKAAAEEICGAYGG